jgi:hypothetical protein
MPLQERGVTRSYPDIAVLASCQLTCSMRENATWKSSERPTELGQNGAAGAMGMHDVRQVVVGQKSQGQSADRCQGPGANRTHFSAEHLLRQAQQVIGKSPHWWVTAQPNVTVQGESSSRQKPRSAFVHTCHAVRGADGGVLLTQWGLRQGGHQRRVRERASGRQAGLQGAWLCVYVGGWGRAIAGVLR